MNIASTDCITFTLVNLVFLVFVIFAIVRNLLWKRPGKIIRGKESRNSFYLTYAFLSVIIMQLIQVSSAFEGHKVLISIINLGALFYLVFYNVWFRNWLIGRLSAWQKRPE